MPARRAKGEGSIYWHARKQAFCGTIELPAFNGRRRRKTVYGPTRAAVRAKLADARGEIDRPSDTITLRQFLADWLASRDVLSLRQATRESYDRTVRLHILPFLSDVTLGEIAPVILEDWLDSLRASTRSIATIRYAKIVLRIALQRAVRRELLASNPAMVLRVKGGTRQAPMALDAQQLGALLDHATPWLRVAILIGGLAGLRRGEVCGLQWDDLNWRTSELAIARSVSAVSGLGEPKTARSRRTVPLPPMVLTALEHHRRRLELQHAAKPGRRPPLAPWIFPSDNGKAKHPRNFLHAYEHARTAAGIPRVRFHDLRHTCATALLDLGTDVKAVSQLLGHTDVRTTLALYHHPNKTAQRKGAQSLQRWLTGRAE